MEEAFRAGIVGSRRRNTLHDRKIVFRLVEFLVSRHGQIVVVSGGCPKGADAFAEEAAKIYGQQKDIYPVDKEGITSKWEFRQAAFKRNQVVAERSSEIYCLVSLDRTGGTENTVSHALELKTPVFLVNDLGDVYLTEDGTYPLCEPVTRLLG